MEEKNNYEAFFNPDYLNFIVEYRGDLKSELSRNDYVSGFIINEKFAVVSVTEENVMRMIKEVRSILLLEFRCMFVLQDVSPMDTSGIEYIKSNENLGLDGRGILIGVIDTGIDYLNQEFMYEDDTTRIVSIWDQTASSYDNKDVFIGAIYNRQQINDAILAKKNGQDPFAIVPSKDEYGHGTKMAGIIGAKGYDAEIEGVANNCEFIVVKLAESANFKKKLANNGIKDVPVYSNCEILMAADYLNKIRRREKKPMIIYIGLGTTENSHDGYALLSRYLDEICAYTPIGVVTGTGNEGDKGGHASGFIKNVGERQIVELSIPKTINELQLITWVTKPNKMSLNVISPSGEESKEIKPKIDKSEVIHFVYENTNMYVKFYVPQAISGQETIVITFNSIKAGIWKFALTSEYVVDGRYDIWLPPYKTLPEGVAFLTPDPKTTLTLVSAAKEAISVGYYDSINNSRVSASGIGYNTNGIIKPNIVAPGVNILTTIAGGGKMPVSGSSVAAAITAGICALLMQWGVIDGNDTSMNSTKLKSYLVYGARRDNKYMFPNEEWGYGILDIKGTFDSISGKRSAKYKEYNVNNLFVRIPI